MLCPIASFPQTLRRITHRLNRLRRTVQEDVIMFSDPHARLPVICDSVSEGVAIVTLSQAPHVTSHKGAYALPVAHGGLGHVHTMGRFMHRYLVWCNRFFSIRRGPGLSKYDRMILHKTELS